MLTINNKTKMLPDSYLKDEDGNNNKLLSIDDQLQADFELDLFEVFGSLDINKAFGKTLDLFGDTLGLKRGYLTDEQFRITIFNRIARNVATTDVNGIITSIVNMLGCDYSDIKIENGTSPATVRFEGIPIDSIAKAGFTNEEALELFKALLPVCVSLESTKLDGTFEFGETEDEYEKTKGFGDEEQKVGGTLGMLLV